MEYLLFLVIGLVIGFLTRKPVHGEVWRFWAEIGWWNMDQTSLITFRLLEHQTDYGFTVLNIAIFRYSLSFGYHYL
jgi:hypothetical protein